MGLHRPHNRHGLPTLTQIEKKSAGRVCLVGAGPGDAGLITVTGLARLRDADVVVVDALVTPTLLEHAPPDARVIHAGKRGGADRDLEQDQINQLLVDEVRAGRRVGRLKGGDPYVFGRGAEEVAYLASHGIEVEVIPGVTAGTSATLTAGIPITHRQIASTVTFVTGHEDPQKGGSSVDYAPLAALVKTGGTLCIYMGIARLAKIVGRLRDAGAGDDTPAAVVQWGATAAQRSVLGTLATIVDQVRDAQLSSPAIIVVGRVAGLDEPGLDFFTRRPLFGQRIVITRTRQQASTFRDMLADLGADVLEAPTIELREPETWAPVDDALRRIGEYDWLILTSTNGVEGVAKRFEALGMDARTLAGVKVASIGDATAEAIQTRLGVRPDLVPDHYVAEALADALIDQHDIAGKRCLLLRADIARKALPERLAAAGAHVTEHTIYRTVVADALPQHVLDALRRKQVDWVTFTSSSTARNLVEMLGDERDLLQGVRLASIGPITSRTMRDLGLEPTVEADPSNLPGLTDVMVGYR